MARSGALERGERRVDRERLGDMLRALGFDIVPLDAAHEGGTKVSAAADILGAGVGSRVLELFERRVGLERLGEGLRALGLEVVGRETVSGDGTKVSAAGC